MSDCEYDGYWVHDDYKQAMNDAILDCEANELAQQTAVLTVAKQLKKDSETQTWSKETKAIIEHESWDTIWAAALKVAEETNREEGIPVPSPETNETGPRYWLKKS